jgi:hypothetical protein
MLDVERWAFSARPDHFLYCSSLTCSIQSKKRESSWGEVLGANRRQVSKGAGAGVVSQRLIPKANDLDADAHRGEGKRFVVHADDKLTAFVELESAIRAGSAAHPKSHRSSFVVRVTIINDLAGVF